MSEKKIAIIATIVILVVFFGVVIHAELVTDDRRFLISSLGEIEQTILEQPFEYPLGNPNIEVHFVELLPGAESGWHTHEKPLIVTVLYGQMVVYYEDPDTGDITSITYKPEDVFIEAIGINHNAFNEGLFPTKTHIITLSPDDGWEDIYNKDTTMITTNSEIKQHTPSPILHAQWSKGVTLDLEGTDTVLVSSNGIPAYDYSDIPKKNPHDVKEQDFQFSFPLYPKYVGDQSPTRPGPIGITLDGSVFFNMYDRDRNNANDSERDRFGSCSGHATIAGIYHTHKLSECFVDNDTANGHSEIFGFVLDGFAVYGYNGINGTAPTDLDKCNGHNDLENYHYHATKNEPYLVGCYNGIES